MRALPHAHEGLATLPPVTHRLTHPLLRSLLSLSTPPSDGTWQHVSLHTQTHTGHYDPPQPLIIMPACTHLLIRWDAHTYYVPAYTQLLVLLSTLTTLYLLILLPTPIYYSSLFTFIIITRLLLPRLWTADDMGLADASLGPRGAFF